MTIGQLEATPHISADYETWGLCGELCLKAASAEHIKLFSNKLAKITSLTGFTLKKASQVEQYLGARAAPLIWLRFERENGINNGLGGEHISATFHLEDKQLMGLTRMLTELDGNRFVTHQTALDKALTFYQNNAPDLITTSKTTPNLTTLPPGTRMRFTPPHVIDHLEFLWIDDHGETLKINQQAQEVHGMKVKAHLATSDAYAWVIIDKFGDIQTFERNILWDFKRMQRKTQMWLHDHWLLAQNIVL